MRLPARASAVTDTAVLIKAARLRRKQSLATALISVLLSFRVSFIAPSLTVATFLAHAQESWRIDSRGAAGPIAHVSLPDSVGKNRGSLIAFEYDRRCDPVFSFAEIQGTKLGKPVGQAVLSGTKIGVLVNGKFHTWHAGITKYDNGYEAGFGVTNELFDLLVGKVDSLVFVTPAGERVPMPTAGVREAVQSAFDICAKRFK